jgi:glutamyl-Q tRNA(Asp) synthetase
MSRSNTAYVGRFAPSPTGPLHFGSIIAALASYLDARHHGGEWLLRMDDLDTPRVQTGADDKILHALEILGMQWDGSVLYQSQRQDAYREAELKLQSKAFLFPCYCSRKLVKGKPYPGTCRQAKLKLDRQHAIRIRTKPGTYTLHDLIQTEYSQNLYDDVGDFIIKRADGLYAYHLAVVLDDAYQEITHIVRGADLMDSTPRQIYLQQQLGLATPVYAHLPLAVSQSGQKICKQSKAKDVLLNNQPTSILFNCLDFLGQKPESGLLQASVNEVLQWGIQNWQLSKVPKLANITAPAKYQSANNRDSSA